MCSTPECHEPIEEGRHCHKTSCLIIQRWLSAMKINGDAELDKNTLDALQFTTHTVNNLTARIEEMKLHIDRQFVQKKTGVKEVRFSQPKDVRNLPRNEHRGLGGGKTKSFDSNLHKLGE